MKKLTLQIDALCVETFQVDPAVAALRGTVQGAVTTDDTDIRESYPAYCQPQPWTEGYVI